MSGINWSENRLIQRVRGHEEELGYIEFEPNSKTYVLWLKDTFGVANTAGAHIRADEYSSMAVAKAEALNAPSVRRLPIQFPPLDERHFGSTRPIPAAKKLAVHLNNYLF